MLAKTRPSITVAEDVLELFLAHADQVSTGVQIRLYGMPLVILRQEAGERYFLQTFEVLAQAREHPLVGRHLQTAAG